MSKAKYYIYRNLRKKDFFSIKFRGKVVDYQKLFSAEDVKLQVSLAGNARAVRDKQRNVHAYAVVDDYTIGNVSSTEMTEVKYNPFKEKSFCWKDTGKPVTHLKQALFKNGRLFGK